MVKNLCNFILSLACAFGIAGTASSQSISVVPNPSAPSIFAWSGSGALSGYSGNPILYNNTLVLEYNASGTSDPTQIVLQLAVYSGGNALQLISNPDAGQGIYLNSIQLIYNNLLFLIYLDATGTQRLASFDGTAITLYPNPDAGLGYIGSPRIFNNKLYVAYSNVSGVTQFGVFTGSSITLIANPDNSTSGFFNDYSLVFDNKLCSRYVTAAGPKQLATFDGNSWTILPNPDATTRGVQPIFPIIYHSKLYWIYFSAANQYQFMQYDGSANPTLIANPENDAANQGGVSAFPIINNDTLFFQYQDLTGAGRLAKFDGTTIKLVPNPDASIYGFYNIPIVYNNQLYIFYVTPDQLHHLAQYVSTGDSLKVYPNPDSGNGYWDQPIVYDNKLFFMYYNNHGIFQVGYFNGGNSLNLLTNPSGVYNGASGNDGYVGQPIIWNNLLYMQFGSVPYGNAGNLAYVNGGTLPITLEAFEAQKAGTTSLLNWETATEINNAYFSIERSSDAKAFTAIGQVAGHGTVSMPETYQFTDKQPAAGVNYYRLKQVDIDGNFTYSATIAVNFVGDKSFTVFPNPAGNSVYLTIPLSNQSSAISIYDANGKKVMTRQLEASASAQYLDISGLAAGMYTLTLSQATHVQTLKLIKK
jgi:hypothetical protein